MIEGFETMKDSLPQAAAMATGERAEPGVWDTFWDSKVDVRDPSPAATMTGFQELR